MPKLSLKIDQFKSGLNTETNERDLSIDSATVSTGLQGFTEGELGTLGGSFFSGHHIKTATNANAGNYLSSSGLTYAYIHQESYKPELEWPVSINTSCEGYGIFSMSHDKTMQYTPADAASGNNFIFFSSGGIIYVFDPLSTAVAQVNNDLKIDLSNVSNDTQIKVTTTSTYGFFTGEEKYGSWKTGQFIVLQDMGDVGNKGDELGYAKNASYRQTYKATLVDNKNIKLTGTLGGEGSYSGSVVGDAFRRVKVALDTGNASHKTFYYNVDGALRVCDRDLTSSPYWFGYINRTRYNGLSPETYTINRWYKDSAYPAKPLEVTADNANANASSLGYGTAPTEKHKVHVRMNFQNDSPYHTGATGWDDATGPAAWKVGVSFVYDGNQESEITEASGSIVLATATYTGKWMSLYCSHFDGTGIPTALDSMTVAPDAAFQASQTHTGSWTATTAITGGGAGFEIKISTNGSGVPTIINSQGGAGYRSGDLFYAIDPGSTSNIAVWQISDTDRWNERITAYKVYLREDSGTEFSKDFYYMGEFDLLSGGKKPFDSDYTAWLSNVNYKLESKTGFYKSPSRAASYTALNGRKYDENCSAKFKTAVIANRRCYIANIEHTPKGSTTVQSFEDRMLKSVVNNFDIFPPNNYVDVSVNDGDRITHLAEYANKILQFKSRRLYIINVAGDSEFLESTHDFMGVDESYQVVRHPNGVAWANKTGVYNYNGSAPTRINYKIDSDYQADFTSGTSIGYDASDNALIISTDNRANDSTCYVYDFFTDSWAKAINQMKINDGSAFTSNTAQTNFVNDADGKLIWMQESASALSFREWSTSPMREVRHTTGNEWATPDITFGSPGQKKNIYKVRITYKAGGSGCDSGVTPKYSIDGSATAKSFIYNNNGSWVNLSDSSQELPVTAGAWSSIDIYPAKAEPTNAGYQESETLVDVDSFKLRLVYNNSYIGDGLVINDITVFYRLKGER